MSVTTRNNSNTNDNLPPCPDGMACSISFERMIDPVFASDGHTYERSSIETWFDGGHTRSPKTNNPLPTLVLTPNLALKTQILEWVHEQTQKVQQTKQNWMLCKLRCSELKRQPKR